MNKVKDKRMDRKMVREIDIDREWVIEGGKEREFRKVTEEMKGGIVLYCSACSVQAVLFLLYSSSAIFWRPVPTVLS